MRGKKAIDIAWSVSMMIIGLIGIVFGILSIAGTNIPHTIRLVIAIVQIIAGLVLIATTVLKVKIKKQQPPVE